MPRSAGVYTLPAGNPVVTGSTISSTWANTTLSDIGSELTNSIAVNGQSVITADIPMAGFKLTGLGNGAASTDAVNFGQVFSSPTFTTPRVNAAPSLGDNSTLIPSTSWVVGTLVNYAPLNSPSLTGTPTAPTATLGDSTTRVASTAFVQAAIANVNASSGALTRSRNSTAAFSIAAGQFIASTYTAGAVAVTAPASPTNGQIIGGSFENNRYDNTIDLGANSVIGPNGLTISGVITMDQLGPWYLCFFGDYWRFV